MWCASRRPPLGVRLFRQFLSPFAVPRRFSLQPSCHLAVVSFSLCSPIEEDAIARAAWTALLEREMNEAMCARDPNAVAHDDVGDHNVTTKTILGARVRQQIGVPHGAHHRRILEGEKKRGIRGPDTRSTFWGCRACKAARRL